MLYEDTNKTEYVKLRNETGNETQMNSGNTNF